MFDVALKVKVKNGILQSFIDKKGWTQSEFARQIGVSVTTVGDWFNMKDYPRTPEKMLQVAEMVEKIPEEIFPDIMRDKDWLTGMREWTVYKEIDLEFLPLHHVAALEAPQIIDVVKLKDGIQKILNTLKPREEKIIKMRFGLDDYEATTLEEVANHFGLNRERIRQIEAKAIRKLRHPKRIEKIKDFCYAD